MQADTQLANYNAERRCQACKTDSNTAYTVDPTTCIHLICKNVLVASVGHAHRTEKWQ